MQISKNVNSDVGMNPPINNTIQYFIGTPLVGLFSDNATNNIDIPIRINYTIDIITTYYRKMRKMNTNKILKYYHELLFKEKSVIFIFL